MTNSAYVQDETVKIEDSEIDDKDFVVIKDEIFKQDKSMVPYPWSTVKSHSIQ